MLQFKKNYFKIFKVLKNNIFFSNYKESVCFPNKARTLKCSCASMDKPPLVCYTSKLVYLITDFLLFEYHVKVKYNYCTNTILEIM